MTTIPLQRGYPVAWQYGPEYADDIEQAKKAIEVAWLNRMPVGELVALARGLCRAAWEAQVRRARHG